MVRHPGRFLERPVLGTPRSTWSALRRSTSPVRCSLPRSPAPGMSVEHQRDQLIMQSDAAREGRRRRDAACAIRRSRRARAHCASPPAAGRGMDGRRPEGHVGGQREALARTPPRDSRAPRRPRTAGPPARHRLGGARRLHRGGARADRALATGPRTPVSPCTRRAASWAGGRPCNRARARRWLPPTPPRQLGRRNRLRGDVHRTRAEAVAIGAGRCREPPAARATRPRARGASIPTSPATRSH